MKTKLQKIETWFDSKGWLGFPRSTWVVIGLIVGIAINLTVIFFIL